MFFRTCYWAAVRCFFFIRTSYCCVPFLPYFICLLYLLITGYFSLWLTKVQTIKINHLKFRYHQKTISLCLLHRWNSELAQPSFHRALATSCRTARMDRFSERDWESPERPCCRCKCSIHHWMLCRTWLRVTGATVLPLQMFHWPLDALQNVIESHRSDRTVVANVPLTIGCFAERD